MTDLLHRLREGEGAKRSIDFRSEAIRRAVDMELRGERVRIICGDVVLYQSPSFITAKETEHDR